jgi:hypothetical protein
MYFNRYDICEAYYLYATFYHGGMGSKEYALFSTFDRIGWSPSLLLENEEHLTDNGREIFDHLVATEGADIRDRR